jgi:uronate dehydrogenase
MKTISITGAAGGVATFLRKELAGRYCLRLSDIATPGNCSSHEEVIKADLGDIGAVRQAVAGCNGIIHLGGYAIESDWETILNANIIGAHNIYEAARIEGVRRIVFASSNHAMGFYDRAQTIDHTDAFRPDSRYGLSKGFGKTLGRLYCDKYAAEVMNIRIGNVAHEPVDERRHAIWISPRDLAQLVTIGLEHPDINFEVVYGMSDNKRAWWDNSNAVRLGYRPKDQSEDYAGKVLSQPSPNSDSPLADARQGGSFVSIEPDTDPVSNP